MAIKGGASTVLQKPVSRMQLKKSLESMGLNESKGRCYTVLIVDDDPRAIEVIATFLPAPGYNVDRAYGGQEAIDKAQALKPDLILLDLMMPDVNGFDVVEALSRNPDTAHIPILVVTAKQITTRDRVLLSQHPDQVVDIVQKAGFDRTQFIAEVRRALNVRQSEEKH
jgi:CheY-like chemotaxis protein